MTARSTLPDWSSLAERDRAGALEQCRDRLSRIGRKLNAVAAEMDPGACGHGPLAGLPYVAKDMIATGVTAPNWGCSEPLQSAGNAASIIESLSGAGACLIGAAEMTELAYEPSGINGARGNVLNPWNFDFIPGGSSSGSAALVASGCCYAALGSDTGGSVRIPAHCCGVTALKPTWGRIAVEGAMPLAPSLDTIGVLARSAADIEQIWGALFGRDAAQAAGSPSAVVLEDAFRESDAEIAGLCRNAIGVLSKLGMRIEGRTGFPDEADQHCLIVMQAEAARTHSARMDDIRINAVLRKRLRKGLSIDDKAYAESLAAREKLRADFCSHYLRDAVVALLPVMPVRTPRFAETDPSSPEFKARTLYALSRFTRFVNYLGLPALAVPAGFDSRGMPVGLQMVGRPDSEAVLLGIGKMLQAETNWHGCVPAAIASDITA